MEIKYVDFSLQYTNEKDQILSSLDRVLSSGQYILGNEVEKFENNFSNLKFYHAFNLNLLQKELNFKNFKPRFRFTNIHAKRFTSPFNKMNRSFKMTF